MSAQHVRLTTNTEDRPTLRLAPSTCRQLGISTKRAKTVRLHFGLRSRSVTVRASAGIAPGDAVIGAAVAKRLLLPDGGQLTLLRTGTQELRLGPLLAVFISEEKLQAVREGFRDSVYRRYTRYAAEIGAYLIFFALSGLNLETGTLSGYRYEHELFVPVQVPLPRIVYDRSFGTGGRDEAEMLRTLARERGMLVLNEPVKITKLDTYHVLDANTALRSVLPHTEPLTNKALLECASTFPAIYLKPDNLSKGQGVFRASCVDGAWLLERSDADGHQSWAIDDSAGVLEHLLPDVPYLVQQAIDLATYHGNQYDLRAAVQKDGKGKWQVTGLVARLAPPRGVVTSPRSGGSVVAAATALAKSFGRRQGERVLADVEHKVCNIAAAIERHYGLCANLGIDLGVSKDGRVWLIEVNGRPLTVSLNRLRDPAITGRIYRYPIVYAASLDAKLPSKTPPRATIGGAPAR